tara:strand:+ start:383 stop:505 length:123 start_codon:yes stop_codon:yes gene_type:complete
LETEIAEIAEIEMKNVEDAGVLVVDVASSVKLILSSQTRP